MEEPEIVPVEQTLSNKIPIVPIIGHPIYPGVFTPLMINSPEDFKAIEFSSVVQVLAYRLAVDFGIDLTDRSMHKEKLYFKTHRDTKKA